MTTEDEQDDIYPPDCVTAHKAQATALRVEAAAHGLRFDGYFVPTVATWVLAEIERGRFLTPADAVFVAMQVLMELEAYPDLRQDLFKREIEKRLADPGPGIPAEEVFANSGRK